ncbi:MAG: ribonuclease E inhibitor RraB [Calditrichaceae bacterium]|nr:ribonuclease E inhibitor RraB [Calditrichaceae bacterium]MBN2707642.1 ribonuclease E inhibitor RraB [Calditrichaceae bacterium]
MNIKKIPEDRDGSVLRLMKNHGADFSKKRSVDFFFYFKDETSANLAKAALQELDLEVEITDNGKNNEWLCLATTKLNLGYNTLIKYRKKFEQIAEKFNGEYDGWETML